MAFSESLNFGNSTFMNIENEVMHAIHRDVADGEGDTSTAKKEALDIIEDSPTKLSKTTFSRSRSRVMLGTLSISNKQTKFRKCKSDSILTVSNDQHKQQENCSNFFQNEFTMEFHVKNQSITPVKDDQLSPASISILEDAFMTDFAAERQILTDDERQNISRAIPVELSDESDRDKPKFKQHPTDIWQDPSSVEGIGSEVLVTENRIASDECQNIDESSFIINVCTDERQKFVAMELEHSKLEVSFDVKDIDHIAHESKKSKSIRQIKNLPSTLKGSPSLLSKNLEELKNLSSWHLPVSVLREYEKKGICKMFDWQIECLSNPKVLFDHSNLVYSAPTSAGKTLVSEILLIKTILERGKKGILILPFISVVREKMFYLQDLLTSSGYRVEGFFGGYTPPGGFDSINVAICTIEKANSIINKLMEQGKLDEIGTIIVDEVHLISDPGRGYILELLVAKILYISRKHGLQIQVITMSATLANVELLKQWLDAELYMTQFRPVALQEMIKIGNKIYSSSNMELQRELEVNETFSKLQNDADHVAQLCIETLIEGCSVIVFCPSKDWCEKLAIQLAGAIHSVGKSGTELGIRLRQCIKRESIEEIKKQLRDIPTGLDSVLDRTITYACAFHHAGLTTEERDIVEASFKIGTLKIIVATSTLSSGVNLPARRVLIRSPLFGGKQMSSLTYRQMIGRAGRTGKDTLGESILICTESNARIGKELVSAKLKPIASCLEMESSTHLKRALLEVVSSGVVTTIQDVLNFVKCTLLSVQKSIDIQHDNSNHLNYEKEDDKMLPDYIKESLDFLLEYEFIRLQYNEEENTKKYMATRLGLACLASSMPPTDGLILFAELQKARRCFVLESELHAVYLVTPYSVCYQLQDLDWLLYLDLWEKLTPSMKKVGELVGIKESFLVRAMRGQTKLDYKLMQIHKRFYTALALQELVNEIPINQVASKYKCTRGMLQSLQQMASTFSGIVTAFCNSLHWSTLSLIVSQFKERLYFGVHHELIDLMRLPDLNQKRARALHDAGITNLIELSNCDKFELQKILINAISFDSAKQYENENELEKDRRNTERNFFITGRTGLTIEEAANLLVHEARLFVQYEIGAGNINWSQNSEDNKSLHMSCEIIDREKPTNAKRKSNEHSNSPRKLFREKESIDLKDDINNENNKGQKNVVTHLNVESKNVEKNDAIHRTVISDKRNKHVTGNSSKENLRIPPPDNKAKKNSPLNNEPHKNDLDNKSVESTSVALCVTPSPIKPRRGYVKTNQHNNLPIDSESLQVKLGTTYVAENTKLSLSSTPVPLSAKSENSNSFTEPQSPLEHQTPPVNGKSSRVVLINKNTKRIKSSLESPIISSPAAPRRSPRNHMNSVIQKLKTSAQLKLSTQTEHNKDMELFMADDSFEINSGLAKELKNGNSNPQPVKSCASPLNSENGNSEEIASSQKTPFENVDAVLQTPRVSRLLRSYRLATPKEQLIPTNSDQNNAESLHKNLTSTSSFECSDGSIAENSLIINPRHLNASHILSCSKEDTGAATCFQSVDIIDICGNATLFKKVFETLMNTKRLGFSVGLQIEAHKRKPLIGANLLLNQVSNAESSASHQDVNFRVDDNCDTYLAGIAISIADNSVFYMNMQEEDTCKDLSDQVKCKYLCMLLTSQNHTLLIHDAKEQLKILRKVLPDLENICVKIEDPKVANWLLQPDKISNFASLAQQFAPECAALVNLCGSGRGYKSIGLDADNAIFAKVRSSIEACVTVHILKGQIENLERIGSGQLQKFFHELEMPMQLSLCNMEFYGFPTCEDELHKLFQQINATMKKVETKIYELNGSRFNLGSSSAVAKVLGLHRKSNGRACTSKQILEKVDSPISQLIVLYRKLSTTLSKSIQPLLKCVINNRIHGQSISFTSTGRISMAEPNLQNVTKDFLVELGDKEKVLISCRRAFFSTDEKRCFISSDFCQLEMRILAHLSQDPTLLRVMNSETDLFKAIAARWNKISEDKVSEQLRNGTKQLCYGIIYGMGMRSLSESLKCTEKEALSISEQFHAAYPGIRVYANRIVNFARHNGYIETITGRRRYLEHINSSEPHLKSQADRQAINSTIQGSAADIAKSAIIRFEKNLSKYCEKLGISVKSVQLVLHLHDELIFEVPEEKSKKIAKLLSVTMENCVKLNVPLKVKLRIGRTWGTLKEVKV